MQVWKMYNTSCMDFHLFFCCRNVERLQGMLVEEEQNIIKPLWQVWKHEPLQFCPPFILATAFVSLAP